MDYERGAYFTEMEDSDVSGTVVVEVDESGEQYRMAEKWDRPESDGGIIWHTYWITAEALNDRLEKDACAYVKQVSAKQFEGILNLAEIEDQVEAIA